MSLSSVWAPACQDTVPRGHAGVGVVSLHGALTLPTFCTSRFQAFFWTDGGIAHLFVVHVHQGAEVDSHKLALTNKLMEAVLGEAKACGTGQPVIIAVDLSAELLVILVTAKAPTCGLFIELANAYVVGREERPAPPVNLIY